MSKGGWMVKDEVDGYTEQSKSERKSKYHILTVDYSFWKLESSQLKALVTIDESNWVKNSDQIMIQV